MTNKVEWQVLERLLHYLEIPSGILNARLLSWSMKMDALGILNQEFGPTTIEHIRLVG